MKVGVGAVVVIKEGVLTDTALEQPKDATAVTFTTFALPRLFNAAVVNVPEPGLPEVKTIVAVVDATVLVPLTLYVTVYVPLARLVEFMVTTEPFPVQTAVADGAVKLVTFGVAQVLMVTFKMPVPLGQILDQFGKGFVIGHSDLHRVHTTGPHLFKDARRPVGILQPVDQMSHADKLSSGSAAPKPENDIIRAIDRQTLGDG